MKWTAVVCALALAGCFRASASYRPADGGADGGARWDGSEPDARDGGSRDGSEVIDGATKLDGGAKLDGGTKLDGATQLDGSAHALDGGTRLDGGAKLDGGSPALDGGGCVPSALTSDPHNCGTCGHDCLGGACSDGACQPVVLASGQTSPRGIAIDDGFVYWTNEGSPGDYSDGSVHRVAKSGGADTPLVTGVNHPWELACDGTDVFYTTLGLANAPTGGVWRIARAGGTPTEIAGSQALPQGIVADGQHLFWTNAGSYSESGNVNSYDHDGAIVRADKDGAGLATLASGENEPVALAFTGWANADGPELAWVNRGGYTASDGAVRSVIGTLASAQYFPDAIACDLDYAYYSVNGGGLRKVPLAAVAGNLPTVLADALGGSVGGVAVDGDFVYFTLNDTVSRVAKSGGAVTALARSSYGARRLALDEHAIYWVASSDGVVMKLAR